MSVAAGMFQRGLQIPPSPFRSSYAQSAVSKAQSSPLRDDRIITSDMQDRQPISQEIRPYMYQTLIYLVGIHAQVTSVADPLLDRILNTAIVKLAEEALRCFRQVKRFGMGGMNVRAASKSHHYPDTYISMRCTLKPASRSDNEHGHEHEIRRPGYSF
ncbi:hypothetical protein H2248_001759 [Termitomyces sp. 'cryptogamus']|nr:hypothetical protein H2248_001759 [Termitomyces sp. 'cryptogamus']